MVSLGSRNHVIEKGGLKNFLNIFQQLMTAFALLTSCDWLFALCFWQCEWPRFGPQTDGSAGSVSNGKRSHLARCVTGGAAQGLEKSRLLMNR